MFWSNSTNPVLNRPAILKFSCFGKLPSGVAMKAEDIKFILSPSFRLRLNASSEPIITLFFLNFLISPLTIFFLRNFFIFFHYCLPL